MLKVTVNEATTFEVKQEKDSWYVNGSQFEGNVVQVSANSLPRYLERPFV